MKKVINLREKRLRRRARTRARISGTPDVPRIAVFRSLRGVALQMIDDVAGKTVAQANFRELSQTSKNTIIEAKEVGKKLGERAVQLGIHKAVFDRSGYRYHGKVKAAAEGLREAGIAC
ncbi:MAG: 50S ribosomal protein L18 [Candidatus Moraniibacteriota bacterium]|nr:MAG: 50S ribosomal protein L18 [Candidatus Moranbacteria bacterium]